MIDICVPYEDFEYNAVGHYRGYFIIIEHLVLSLLTILYFRIRSNKTPTEMYIKNLLLLTWPILPLRLLKAVYTAYFPVEASQSPLLCLLLQIETTLQYTFSLAHLLQLTYFARQVSKHRSVSFQVTRRMRNHLFSLDLFSLVTSALFVNLQISSGIVKIFGCIYALPFVLAFPFYLVQHLVALIKSTCKRFRRWKEDDENHFSYFWFYLLQFLTTVAHLYQFCAIQTLLVPVIFPQFTNDYLITFRYVTGVLSVRFMVSIILSTAPLILLPPIRRHILEPCLKKKRHRVAATSDEVVAPDQIQVTFVS